MAYRFKLTEPFDAGVRRIGGQQIDRAITLLSSVDEAATAIHNTRKTLKRLRALLRITRPGLSDGVYAHENARHRDIGRLLAEARDRHVLAETLQTLELSATGRTKTALKAAQLKLTRVERPERLAGHAEHFRQAVEQLREGQARMADLEIARGGYEIAWEGLERVHRQAARAFDCAYKSPSDEALHDFRKRTQYHFRHMLLLSPAWPEMLEARVATARRLSALLGEDHDIAVMMASLDACHAVTPGQRKLIEVFGRKRQQVLRDGARNLGERLFAVPAHEFRDQVKHYWAAAQAAGLSKEKNAEGSIVWPSRGKT